MQANELRIGNLVLINSNIHEVDVVDYNQVIATETGLIELKYVNPIPLTEEWLLRFGFTKECAYKQNGYEITSYEDGYVLDNGISIVGERFLYVHQLQNLYFALTGQELTFKSE